MSTTVEKVDPVQTVPIEEQPKKVIENPKSESNGGGTVTSEPAATGKRQLEDDGKSSSNKRIKKGEGLLLLINQTINFICENTEIGKKDRLGDKSLRVKLSKFQDYEYAVDVCGFFFPIWEKSRQKCYSEWMLNCGVQREEFDDEEWQNLTTQLGKVMTFYVIAIKSKIKK